jgi:pilus assembly protein CpaB
MNRRILLIASAVVLALVGTFAVYGYAKSADNRAVADTKAATVLVTTKRIPAGTSWADTVKGNYLKSEHLPTASVPSSALTNVAHAAIGKDAVAQADIAPGQIVLRQSYGTKTSQTGVLAIPKGDIAVSVQLPSDADVANYVAPGSDVIIFVTSQLKTKTKYAMTNGDDLMVTRTVVPRATVIATSNTAPTAVAGTTDATTTSTDSTTMLTLGLSQYDAERVILAQNAGSLYLGLLSSSSKVDQDGGVINAGYFKPVPVWLQGQGTPPVGEPAAANSANAGTAKDATQTSQQQPKK